MSGALHPRLARLIRQDVQSMQAYAIQDSAGLVKLDAMENPHLLPLRLQAELGQRLGRLPINRYPDGRIHELRRALAAHAGLPEGFDLMMGNGSDELISLLAMACDLPGAVVLAPVPGFVMYAMSAQLQGLGFVGVPLTADFKLDRPAMLAAIAQHRPALTYLAYPNNPTANCWDASDLEAVIEAVQDSGGLVVIDEAYQPFAGRSFIDRIGVRDHVLLMRTLSKFGLAGVRLGYLMGPRALIAEIDKVRPPYNVSMLNSECALFALEHADVFASQAREVVSQRERLMAALAALPGVQPFPSDANMILVRLAGAGDRASQVFQSLKSRGVLVKNISKMHPLLANCLRLTVGTAQENQQLLQALGHSL